MAATQQQINDCLAAADLWNEKDRLAQRASAGVNDTQASLSNIEQAMNVALRFDENAAVREALLTLLVELPKSIAQKQTDSSAANAARDAARLDYDDALFIVKNA